MKKFLKSKKIKLVFIVTLVFAIGSLTSLAFLHANTPALTNTFTVGDVTTKIEEEIETIGTKIKKEPVIVNTGKNDCLVRVRVTVTPELKDIQDMIKGWNNETWTKGEDGYYYYKGILKAGNNSKTTPLFTHIVGLTQEDGSVKDEYKDIINDLAINVYQESVQAIVYKADGTFISAKENPDNAKIIWDLYDNGRLDTSLNN